MRVVFDPALERNATTQRIVEALVRVQERDGLLLSQGQVDGVVETEAIAEAQAVSSSRGTRGTRVPSPRSG